jgi:hypothetical protein
MDTAASLPARRKMSVLFFDFHAEEFDIGPKVNGAPLANV